VSGYLHIPATLCPGKGSPYFTGEETGGPYVMPGCVGEEKNLSLSLQENYTSIFQPVLIVTTLTGLFRFSELLNF
jgi:hypothetical protein